MKLPVIFLFLILISQNCPSFAQTSNNIQLNFLLLLGDSTLQLGENYYKTAQGDSFLIETFRFYISNIEFLNDGKTVWKDTNTAHLIDAENPKSLSFLLEKPDSIAFSQLQFCIGIDSLTNVSGVMGGDLDPTKGMYWTWQSGYINLKLEGKSNLCTTKNKDFQFHLGGYQTPFYALQKVSFFTSKEEKIELKVNILTFLQNVNVAKENHIMSPNQAAVLMAQQWAKAFKMLEK